jgi:hypothetical protein
MPGGLLRSYRLQLLEPKTAMSPEANLPPWTGDEKPGANLSNAWAGKKQHRGHRLKPTGGNEKPADQPKPIAYRLQLVVPDRTKSPELAFKRYVEDDLPDADLSQPIVKNAQPMAPAVYGPKPAGQPNPGVNISQPMASNSMSRDANLSATWTGNEQTQGSRLQSLGSFAQPIDEPKTAEDKAIMESEDILLGVMARDMAAANELLPGADMPQFMAGPAQPAAQPIMGFVNRDIQSLESLCTDVIDNLNMLFERIALFRPNRNVQHTTDRVQAMQRDITDAKDDLRLLHLQL